MEHILPFVEFVTGDLFDAVMAAALLLKVKVGHKPLTQLNNVAWEAAKRYNGAGKKAVFYANQVLAQARKWEAANALTQQPTASLVPQMNMGLGGGRLAWPVPSNSPITGRFGEQRPGHHHSGVDFGAASGTPFYAAHSGKVTRFQRAVGKVGYGNFVCVSHTHSLSSCYAHLSQFATSSGATLARGQLLGYVGSTGHRTGPHLHFEVRVNDRPVNPLPYLNK